LNRVHDFEEGRGVGASRLGTASGGGLGDGDLDGASRARAALGLFASRLLALQLALGLGAVGGLGALLVAGEFFADWSTLGLRSLAGGVALGRLADRLALGASLLLTLVLGAADRANGLLAVNGALWRKLSLRTASGTWDARKQGGTQPGKKDRHTATCNLGGTSQQRQHSEPIGQ